MPHITVTSVDDLRLTPYRDLPNRKSTEDSRLFIAEGALLVQRLLASDYVTDSVLVTDKRADSLTALVRPETPVYVASRRVLEQIIGFSFHHGMIACGRREPLNSLDHVLATKRGQFTLVICVDILDPENLGGILRNSAAFGADAVMVTPHCTDPFSRRVLRVSMGTAFRVPVVETNDLEQELMNLRTKWRTHLVAAVLDDRCAPLKHVPHADRVAILLGNEADGLAPQWTEACDCQITIPLQNGTDSLNVSVAAGIFLYHFQSSYRPAPGRE